MTGLFSAAFANPELSFHRQRNDVVTSLSTRNTIQATRCWERLGRCGITKPLDPVRAFGDVIVAEFCKVQVEQCFLLSATSIFKIRFGATRDEEEKAHGGFQSRLLKKSISRSSRRESAPFFLDFGRKLERTHVRCYSFSEVSYR